MTPAQYLAACKTKLGHCSDYALAKKWDLDKGYMSKLTRGVTPINARVACLIAITLELDPLMVLADIEAQQQTGKAQDFWKSFLSRVQPTITALLFTLALVLFAGLGNARAGTGGLKPVSHN